VIIVSGEEQGVRSGGRHCMATLLWIVGAALTAIYEKGKRW